MKPIEDKEINYPGFDYIVFAKDQPEYLPLPAWKLKGDSKGTVITAWEMSFIERLRVLFTGKIYLSLLTFNKPLTPNRIYSEKPFKYYVEVDQEEVQK